LISTSLRKTISIKSTNGFGKTFTGKSTYFESVMSKGPSTEELQFDTKEPVFFFQNLSNVLDTKKQSPELTATGSLKVDSENELPSTIPIEYPEVI